jgi:hypothetical protein
MDASSSVPAGRSCSVTRPAGEKLLAATSAVAWQAA